MLHLTRRQFLHSAGAAATLLLVAPRLALAQAGGPLHAAQAALRLDARRRPSTPRRWRSTTASTTRPTWTT